MLVHWVPGRAEGARLLLPMKSVNSARFAVIHEAIPLSAADMDIGTMNGENRFRSFANVYLRRPVLGQTVPKICSKIEDLFIGEARSSHD